MNPEPILKIQTDLSVHQWALNILVKLEAETLVTFVFWLWCNGRKKSSILRVTKFWEAILQSLGGTIQ